MRIEQKPKFKKKYKKLHDNQRKDVNKAIEAVINNTDIGQQKIGDLDWLRVYKFKMVGQLTLLGYYVEPNGDIVLTFVDFGPHENFYRDLKK